ncbi:MAG: hypothetical protein NT166_11555 [Candidatus Aminicenantes bacterium]|nr:hypothetical protein [Candidatus Aminicenantes bacterium]
MIKKKRKSNKLTYLIVLISILVLSSLPAVSQTSDEATAVAREFQARLQLTPEQATGVVKIFKMAQSQALMDRENFKGNALALIQAAIRRREMTDGLVEGLLTPEQKPIFADFKEKRKMAEEFFLLNEGLLLTEEQSVQVKQILDEYRELLIADRENMAAMAAENGGDLLNDPYGNMQGGVGNMSGTVPGSIPGNVPSMMRGGMRGGGIPGELRGANEESRMLEAMKDQDAKKEKKIQKVLTEEQQKMYKDIIKMQQQELKKRLEERRQG